MKPIFKKIGLLLFCIPLISFASSYPVGGQPYSLAGAGITASANSITLTSFTIAGSGQAILMSNFGTVGYGTIEPQTINKSEFISFTGVTQNANGTATLTGVQRGLSPLTPYTASTTLAQSHTGGKTFIISDVPAWFGKEFVFANTPTTITSVFTFASTAPAVYDGHFSVSSTSNQIISAWWAQAAADTSSSSLKNYIDTTFPSSTHTWSALQTFSAGFTASAGSFNFSVSPILNAGATGIYQTASTTYVTNGRLADVSFAGTVNADEITKGIVQIAYPNQAASGTSNGSTGARLIIGANIATSTSQVATSSVVVTQSTGKISNTFLNGTDNYTFNGNTTMSATTTMASTTITQLNISSCVGGCGATTTSIFPRAAFTSGSTTIATVNTNTSLRLGQVEVLQTISANYLTVSTPVISQAGSQGIFAMWTQNGLTRLFSTTTTITTATTTIHFDAPILINPGKYYVGVLANGTANFFLASFVPDGASSVLNGAPVSGKNYYSGSVTVSASTMPSTISPSTISDGLTGGFTPVMRFDN